MGIRRKEKNKEDEQCDGAEGTKQDDKKENIVVRKQPQKTI